MQYFVLICVPIQEIVLLDLYPYSVLLQHHFSTAIPAADQPHFYEPVGLVLRKSTFFSIWAFQRQFFSAARKLLVVLLLPCKSLAGCRSYQEIAALMWCFQFGCWTVCPLYRTQGPAQRHRHRATVQWQAFVVAHGG